MILVTTAGKVGAEAARQIARQQEQVRVLVRHPETAEDLAEAGVDVVQGDLEVPSTIDVAMRDVTSVVLVTAAVPSQELNVIRSAVAAGVDHVVKLTAKSSADSPIRRRRDQARIESALIESGIEYTLLKSNAYMQNFLMMAPSIVRTNSFATATGAGRIGHVDARDVGVVAAAIALSPAQHARKTYWPTGPQALSGLEVAEVFTQVLGRSIRFTPVTFDEQKNAMLAAGLPEQIAEDNARAVSLMADGEGDYVTDVVASVLGRPPRSFEQFVTDFAAVFR